MYFECHVVVKPPYEVLTVQEAAKEFRFWMSTIQHDEGDDDEKAGDLIFTTRAQAYSEIELQMIRLCRKLREKGVRVKRYKIEFAVVDSKSGDVHGFLPI